MARRTRTAAEPRPPAAAARGAAVRLLAGLAALALTLTAPASAPAGIDCKEPRGFDARGRIESGDVVVLFRTVPAAIEIGQHFAVEAIVCAGPPGAPSGLRVDAYMPEHRHGMNYRPTVTSRGGGAYVAEGLLFHMPGLWQLRFDVERGGRTERLTADMEIE